MKSDIIEACTRRPKAFTWAMVGVTMAVVALALVPTFVDMAPFKPLAVDTDPENMLSSEEPVRVFHEHLKEELALHEMIAVGVINEKHPDGIFNVESLRRVYELTEFAKTLQWEIDGKTEGVVEIDIMAPSVVDNIEQGGLGSVRFDWLMPEPPKTAEEARAVRTKLQRLPFFDGSLLSDDGKAIGIYLPITRKDVGHRIYVALNDKIAELGGDDQYHIAGLPVAEDVFGVEMFVQMAISAPAAMMLIFVLMLIFFRKLVLIIAPMIIANVAVCITMGLLVISGFPVHIMSSMIPIFIMPIAVLDAVHILSDFFERYQQTKDRQKTIVHVVKDLYAPMLYTSLTTAAGFASLALAPIPPVQVFGVFVAIGVLLAWGLTMTFMPAYVMFLSPKGLESFGRAAEVKEGERTILERLLARLGSVTYRRAKLILTLSMLAMVIGGYGITRIHVNDNPVRWFAPSHPIRVADDILNDHFDGIHPAYLALSAREEAYDAEALVAELRARAEARAAELKSDVPAAPEVFAELPAMLVEQAKGVESRASALAALADAVTARQDAADDDAMVAWEEAGLFVDEERQRSELFKDPEILRYIADLQSTMLETGVVGKSNSLADLVKTVHRELLLGKDEEFRIPDTSKAVAQSLITFQSSHRPHDLWHFVTPDYRTTNIWVQLTSGDNQDMSKVTDAVAAYIAANPPPADIDVEWSGLTYINVVWQDKMVWGMLEAFASSFLVVFVLMTILFRSALWGLLAMLPLTVTIVVIYGIIGLVDKPYDMPVAILSALSLGLAVDFATHFLVRARRSESVHGSWEKAAPIVFGEPARAITRNIIVVAIGFTPLLIAPLTPYRTVGVLMASILLLSGVATLIIMPALVRVLSSKLFQGKSANDGKMSCGAYIASVNAGVAVAVISMTQYSDVSLSLLIGVGVSCGLVLSALSCMLGRRRAAASVPHE